MPLKCPLNGIKKRQQCYSSKKKRHTLKVQVVVAQKSKRIVCTTHDKGTTHDFKVLKKSKLPLRKGIKKKLDSGYQGAEKLHPGGELPKKGTKHHPLTRKEKAANRKLASERVMVEHVIGRVKVPILNLKTQSNRSMRAWVTFGYDSASYLYPRTHSKVPATWAGSG